MLESNLNELLGFSKLPLNSYEFGGRAFTTQELWCLISDKINIIIETFNYFNKEFKDNNALLDKKLEYLINEGLNIEVGKKVIELVDDGTLGTLINSKLLGDINTKVDNFKSLMENDYNTKINSLSTNTNNKFNLVNDKVSNKIDNKTFADNNDFIIGELDKVKEYINLLVAEKITLTSSLIENKKYAGGINLGDSGYKVDNNARVCTKSEYVSNGTISVTFDSTNYDMYYVEYTSNGTFVYESDWYTYSPCNLSISTGNKIGVMLAKKDRVSPISLNELDNGLFKILLYKAVTGIDDSGMKLSNTNARLLNEQSGVIRVGSWNLTFAHTKYNELTQIIKSIGLNVLGIQEYRGGNTQTTLHKYTNNVYMPTYHLCPSIVGLAILSVSNLYQLSKSAIELGMHGGTEKRVISKQEILINGKKVSLYTVHLDYLPISNAPQLMECLDLLNTDVNEYKIMIGDFNVINKSDFNIFTDNGYKISNGKDGIWYETYKDDNGASTKCIDNIIVSGNIDILKVSMYDVNKEYADHNLIYSDILLK